MEPILRKITCVVLTEAACRCYRKEQTFCGLNGLLLDDMPVSRGSCWACWRQNCCRSAAAWDTCGETSPGNLVTTVTLTYRKQCLFNAEQERWVTTQFFIEKRKTGDKCRKNNTRPEIVTLTEVETPAVTLTLFMPASSRNCWTIFFIATMLDDPDIVVIFERLQSLQR